MALLYYQANDIKFPVIKRIAKPDDFAVEYEIESAKNTNNAVETSIITCEDEINKDAYETAKQLYSYLPTNVIQLLEKDNWTIFICKNIEDYDDNYREGDTGVTIYPTADKPGIIYLVDDLRLLKESFYHEIGHVIDNKLDTISGQHDFREIYYDEKLNCDDIDKEYLCTWYAKGSSKEYFAEIFQLYLYDEKECKEHFPETHAFITKLLFK